MTITYTWTMATWETRGAAEYQPIDQPINGAFIDKFGHLSNTFGADTKIERNPYKIEDTGSGTVYKTYVSGSGVVPIIKIVEA